MLYYNGQNDQLDKSIGPLRSPNSQGCEDKREKGREDEVEEQK